MVVILFANTGVKQSLCWCKMCLIWLEPQAVASALRSYCSKSVGMDLVGGCGFDGSVILLVYIEHIVGVV